MDVESTAASDDFQREVDHALRHKRRAAVLSVGITAGLALVLSLGGFLTTAPSREETIWTSRFLSEWSAWSQDWATKTEVNATVIGLLTAALTLYVSTTLQSISRDVDPSGAASRILLDDITLLVCITGAVTGWILAAGAGWHERTALAWAPASATSVLLAVLAVSTEARALTRRQRHWTLHRAKSDLERALGGASRRSWFRAFPWRSVTLITVVATLPTAVGLVLAYDDALVGVPLAVAAVALVWFVLIGTSWGSVARIRAARVRHGQWFLADTVLTFLYAVAIVTALGLVTWSVADGWGRASFALALLAAVAPVALPVAERQLHRQLHRQLAAVDKELDEVTAQLAATPPDPPGPPPGAVPPTWLPTDRDLDWVVQVGGFRILRFRGN